MTQEDGPNWKSTESETARERELWREELRLKERELALKESEHQRSRWTNPLVLAVVAAALAALGNAVVALINGSQQRALEASQRALEETRANNEQVIEETKEEAVRILEVIKAHDDKSRQGSRPDDSARSVRHRRRCHRITVQDNKRRGGIRRTEFLEPRP